MVAAGAMVCFAASQAMADIVTITKVGPAGPQRTRGVSAAESGSATQPAPTNGDVFQFQVTTDGDILSVNNVQITLDGGATLFQNTFGDAGNANKPTAGLEAAFPSITADTWLDTPGVGSRLGPDLPGDGTTTVGDTSNDGPQTNFIFAQITVPHLTKGTFSGRISIAGQQAGTIFDQPFSFAIPEPASAAMAAFGLLGAIALRRRTA
jgi:hypothetical protein